MDNDHSPSADSSSGDNTKPLNAWKTFLGCALGSFALVLLLFILPWGGAVPLLKGAGALLGKGINGMHNLASLVPFKFSAGLTLVSLLTMLCLCVKIPDSAKTPSALWATPLSFMMVGALVSLFNIATLLEQLQDTPLVLDPEASPAIHESFHSLEDADIVSILKRPVPANLQEHLGLQEWAQENIHEDLGNLSPDEFRSLYLVLHYSTREHHIPTTYRLCIDTEKAYQSFYGLKTEGTGHERRKMALYINDQEVSPTQGSSLCKLAIQNRMKADILLPETFS